MHMDHMENQKMQKKICVSLMFCVKQGCVDKYEIPALFVWV